MYLSRVPASAILVVRRDGDKGRCVAEKSISLVVAEPHFPHFESQIYKFLVIHGRRYLVLSYFLQSAMIDSCGQAGIRGPHRKVSFLCLRQDTHRPA